MFRVAPVTGYSRRTCLFASVEKSNIGVLRGYGPRHVVRGLEKIVVRAVALENAKFDFSTDAKEQVRRK